ncbi:MAG: hypothetical protein N2689_11925, partial [Verrucomicrobiae bacterium]|nr:hypothetical protein [Verrucomicrobiae bacterium]
MPLPTLPAPQEKLPASKKGIHACFCLSIPGFRHSDNVLHFILAILQTSWHAMAKIGNSLW